MQYLEDIIELVEDLPDEIGRRFEQIRKWDNDVERLRLECRYATKRIMEVRDTSQPTRDKILMEIADKYRLIRRLSERKLDLAIRSERLMSAVFEKVADSSYLCKIELEVDNPGCTETIERNFCRVRGLKPTSSHLTSCNVEFEPVEDAVMISVDQDRNTNGKLSPLLESVLSNDCKDRERSYSPRSSSCASPQPRPTSGPKFKKRKLNGDDSPSTNLTCARKKQEKSRVYAGRQEERGREQQKIALGSSEADFTNEVLNPDLGKDGVQVKWEEQDPLGSEDDFDASDVMGLFPSLPSPPREIMESLKEDSLFPDDDYLNYDSSHPTGFPHSPGVQGILLDSVASSPSPSTSVSSWDRKKRTSISFGNVNETTSLHGRPRKMTERAVELLQSTKDREKQKRGAVKTESVEGDSNERWCFCREVSSGNMICCDAPDCKYQWFHFECVGVDVEPKGQWFCSECSARR